MATHAPAPSIPWNIHYLDSQADALIAKKKQMFSELLELWELQQAAALQPVAMMAS